MITSLETKPCKEHLRELDMFSLEDRKLRTNIIAISPIFKCHMEDRAKCHMEDREGLSSVAPFPSMDSQGRLHRNRSKLQDKRFEIIIRKKFLAVRAL